MNEKERTAYHEAGHAVVHCLLCVRFSEVSIVESLRGKGHVTWAVPEGYCHESLSRTEKCIMCCLGGPVVGDIVGQCPNYSMSDGERAYALALNWTDDRQETHELVARLRKSARSMIEQPENWAAIKALAHELVEVDTVSGDRACQIVTDSIAQAKQGD